jgi:hypothetical protein
VVSSSAKVRETAIGTKVQCRANIGAYQSVIKSLFDTWVRHAVGLLRGSPGVDTIEHMSESGVGVDGVAPGADLAAALAGLDLSQLPSEELEAAAAACARQVAHYQALLWSAVHELGRTPAACPPGQVRREAGYGKYAAEQVAWPLRWTLPYARRELDLAHDMIHKLPAVHTAVRQGQLDRPRAMLFHRLLTALGAAVATDLAERLLAGGAATLDYVALQHKVDYQIRKHRPDKAAADYRNGLAERRVWHTLNPDGTASLGGTNLPADLAAAAYRHCDILARTARASGDTRTLNQLRADILLHLAAGLAITLQHTTTNPHPHNTANPADRDSAGRDAAGRDPADRDAAGDCPGGSTSNEPAPAAATHAAAAAEPAGPEPAAVEPAGPEPPGDGAPIGSMVLGECPTEVLWPAEPLPEPDDEPDEDPNGGGPRLVISRPRRAVVDIQVKLSTLMGLNQDPALLIGWGPVIADIARRVAFDEKINPIWRFSVTDEHGQLLHHGHTNRRPSTTEQAFVRARDRTCRAPYCHRPATGCDLDHRQPWTDGGPSHRGNLTVLCRRHHVMKHELGYRLEHITGGQHKWTKPNGRQYHTTDNHHQLPDDPNQEPDQRPDDPGHGPDQRPDDPRHGPDHDP